jgi:hypothetical protein
MLLFSPRHRQLPPQHYRRPRFPPYTQAHHNRHTHSDLYAKTNTDRDEYRDANANIHRITNTHTHAAPDAYSKRHCNAERDRYTKRN